MPDKYDMECPICGELKMLLVEDHTGEPNTIPGRIEPWAYAPGNNEFIIEAFCPRCGLKFVYPYWGK